MVYSAIDVGDGGTLVLEKAGEERKQVEGAPRGLHRPGKKPESSLLISFQVAHGNKS